MLWLSLLAVAAVPNTGVTITTQDLPEPLRVQAETLQELRYPGGEFLVPNEDNSGQTAAIVIRGDNLVVDFGGLVLRGTPADAEPDERRGTGIRVEGENVTVKNVRVHGYHIGLIAVDAPGIKILDSDFSHNFRPRLRSTLEGEDTSDWMSFHNNEEDQWLRFGAGIYLRNADGAEIRNVTIRYGACGLMMTETHNALIWNNDFSFLSAVGLGLYRSSGNRIMHNNIDWCVRGYSYGVYNRGQDSTGVLLFESTHRNVFAYNSVTHGGDGFFLWAGQDSMDTGEGGANDNLLYGNDWSHAPTNGIEATFSRNQFVNNLLMENWHGIWGGYSFDTHIVGNVFAFNAEAIAIEHGQNNVIRDNLFYRDLFALAIWANEQEGDWPYANNRDTRSRGYTVRDNTFDGIMGSVLNVSLTEDFHFFRNVTRDVNRVFETELGRVSVRGTTAPSAETLPDFLSFGNRFNAVSARFPDFINTWENLQDRRAAQVPPVTMTLGGAKLVTNEWNREANREQFRVPLEAWNPWPTEDPDKTPLRREVETWAPRPLEGGKDPFLGLTDRGRRFILVNEWGPIDFRRTPTLFPRTVAGMRYAEGAQAPEGIRRFEVFGPAGEWRVAELRGVLSISAESGQVGEVIDIAFDPAAAEHRVELIFLGEEAMDHRGVITPAGEEFAFGWNQFRLPISWQVQFFAWDPTTQDPRTQEEAFRQLLAGEPIHTEVTTELNYVWPGVIAPNLPADYFATVARGDVRLEPGEYLLEVTSDDGVRVYIDGELVIDEWQYQGPTTFTRTLTLGGDHEILVEHFEINGFATLRLDLTPIRE